MIAHLHRAVVGAALLFSATTSSQAEQPVSVGTKGELRVVYSFNAVGEKVLGSDLSEKWKYQEHVRKVLDEKFGLVHTEYVYNTC